MSRVWKYVEKSMHCGKCKLCYKSIKTGGNTTNLRNHIIKVHKIPIDDMDLNQNENEATNESKRQKQGDLHNFFDAELDERVETDDGSTSASLYIRGKQKHRTDLNENEQIHRSSH